MRIKVHNNRLKVYGGRAKYNYFTESKAVVDAIQTTDQLNAVQRLYGHFIVGMEINEGVWNKSKAVYGMVGGTAAAHKWNWKDMRDLDVAFRKVYSGGFVHNNNGESPNGTTGWADTFFKPFGNITRNDNSFCLANSGTFNGGYVFNSRGAGNTNFGVSFSPTNIYYIPSDFGDSGVSSTISSQNGVFVGTRKTGLSSLYMNSVLLATKSNLASGNYDDTTFGINLYRYDDLNRSHPRLYTTGTYGFASIGSGLTDTEAIQMSQIINFAQKMRANF